MDKNYYNKYWKTIGHEAWKLAWERSGMKVLIPFMIVLLGASALGGFLFMIHVVEYPFFRDNSVANSITGLSQVFLSMVILL